MFQSLESYFQKHRRAFVRTQYTNPANIQGVLNQIFEELHVPVKVDEKRVMVKNSTIIIQGLSGGERHLIVKRNQELCTLLSSRTGGVITDARFQ
ncbi:MAG: hypothetical protein AAB343_00530 [Patescibacteria group bacterium]